MFIWVTATVQAGRGKLALPASRKSRRASDVLAPFHQIWSFGGDRRGVLLVEYALIAAVMAMVAVAAMVSIGAAASVPFQRVQTTLQSVLHGGHSGGGFCNPPGAGKH